MKDSAEKKGIRRPPIITIMGHIDHGKSTLLDYIRNAHVADSEVGGITQHLSAYEVVRRDESGKDQKITFLDTPGHEAFTKIRSRGVDIADIAVLVVSAEDGVKPQTLEALKIIEAAKLPFVVAINKIDKPSADIEKTKMSLAENGIYLEGYGGNTTFVAISAKTGQGVNDLLDTLLLIAEMEDLRAEKNEDASGVVIESSMDTKKGISATLIIKSGTLMQGMFVVAGESLSPVRIMEDFAGKKIKQATFSSPIRIIGWSKMPVVGSPWKSFISKKEAESDLAKNTETLKREAGSAKKEPESDLPAIPVVIKADTIGSAEAIEHEIKKLKSDRIRIKVLHSGIGPISENDVKLASGTKDSLIVGFNSSPDASANALALRLGIEVKTFNIIYALTEWLQSALTARTPKMKVEEAVGKAKIMKIFSSEKDRYIIGGRADSGIIVLGENVKIIRRNNPICEGRIKELQHLKNKVSEIEAGKEFGALIQAPMEVAAGDYIECYKVVEK